MSQKIKNLIIIFIAIIAIFAAAHFALAQDDLLGLEYGEATGLGTTDLRIIIANIIRIALGLLGIIAVILVMLAGWLWMTAGGNAEQIDKAKKILTGALIGLLIIISSFAIVSFVLTKLYEATGGGNGGPPGGGPPGPPPDPPPVSCDSNTLTPECDADSSMCEADYYCDDDSCTCQSGGGYGDPCDGDVGTAECEADDNLCSAYLHCDESEGCICLGNPVIEWISPLGGFCDGDINTPCRDDNDCAAFATSTCNTTVPNGAVNNFVAIGGRYFGDIVGEVYFSDGSTLAVFPDSVNPNCDNNWQDKQIIVVVPSGAVSGAIKVVRSDGEEDSTDDTRGPVIPDFVVNNIIRPGLCKLDPDHGVMNDVVNYDGINLLNNVAYFGDQEDYVIALNSSFLNPLSGTAEVANIRAGRTTSFTISDSGENSNYLKFSKDREPYLGPYINSFEPVQGNIGQYVTIYGSGFGRTRGNLNYVYFDNGVTRAEASYEFPDVCADSVWSDNQVIVKVPPGLTDGSYTIVMELGGELINTSSLSPNSFNVDSSLSLVPSLCKLEPIMGPANSEVNLWGEYFEAKDDNSRIRFYAYKDQTGEAISFWDLDPEITTGIQPHKAVTTVHQEAVTGPVKVVKDSPGLEGNGMNFNIGLCTEADDPDEACGSWACCPAGSLEAGKCKVSMNDCYISILSSVYEWDFSTGGQQAGPGDPCYDLVTAAGCDPNSPPCAEGYYCDSNSCTCQTGDDFDSCYGYSLDVGRCDPIFCPNSPGQCSPYAGGGLTSTGVACSNEACNSIGACAGETCLYNSNLDRCVLSDSSCDFPTNTLVQDILGNQIEAYCADYNGVGRWHIETNLSCPIGWTMLADSRCVNENLSCDLCSSGFVCLDDDDGDNEGVCAVDQDICPANSTCGAEGECLMGDQASCECCCEIGQDARDCCVPLICEGVCGDDVLDDGAGFGHCSGCALAGTTQEEKDDACNCFGHSGKYCDIEAAGGQGICRDCAQLSTPEQCSRHSSFCCVDGMKDNQCRGIDNGATVNQGGFDYCAYYSCETEEPYDCDITPAIVGSFRDLVSCQEECGEGGNRVGMSCYDENFNICAKDCAVGYICLGEDGCLDNDPDFGCQAGDESCLCCCNPSPTDDHCSDIDTGDATTNLVCQADIEPCSGDFRGICCGCSQDEHCGDVNNVGCSFDSCCRARPNIEETIPAAGAENVCRNALITATFNQTMKTNSFTGNVVVVGDYGHNTCPAGTEYLALGGEAVNKDNIFVQVYYKILKVFKKFLKPIWGDNALAQARPDHNYCAITGTVRGEQGADNKTRLIFSPSQLLDTDITYYVIIKGDKDLDSSQGVLSYWGIGMNGPDWETFNGITFENAKVFSFTTLPEQADNNGVCEIDQVVIDPGYYLFQTTENNLNDENDSNCNDVTFDTVKDSDKVFVARAAAIDGQVLAPVPGYAWQWFWSIDNTTVVDFFVDVVGLEDNKKLIRAEEDITDGKTHVKAAITLTDSQYSSVGDGEEGTAEVWVFLCNNPWPPVKASGLWEPWRDTETNCTIMDQGCYSTNYELYYCRDTRGSGTADDLPTILSDDTVTRGRSSIQNILKESYFLREELPDVSGINLVAVEPAPSAGGKVELYWSDVIVPQGETFKEYTIYYGTSPGLYSNSITTSEHGVYNDPGNPFTVTGLNNDTTYYFAITAKYVSGAESEYSNEVVVTPHDSAGPVEPIINEVLGLDKKVEVSWTGNSDAVGGYRIYYGADTAPPGQFGSSVAVAFDLSGITTITNLANNITYRFGMIAYDEYGNPSATSTIVTAIPLAE